jgi:glutamyl-tRNA reductase
MSIVVVGISHHSSPVSLREHFAFTEDELDRVMRQLTASGLVHECVLLSTCNRVEIYAATPQPPAEALRALKQFLLENRAYKGEIRDEIYGHANPASVEHLFRVASGLDSLVLGETEILGQLKKAYHLAKEIRLTGACLNKVFQKAFNVAKHIRSSTGIQRGSTSVGSVAVELADKIFDGLHGRRVMVIGAGDTSEKTARSLLSRGASELTVTNRSLARAEELARKLGGRAIGFTDWETEFEQLDIVISSTSASSYILDRARLEPLVQPRGARPLLLIDIAVPRDIDPEINDLDNVYLYNIDHLQSIAQDYLDRRQKEIAYCEAFIQSKASEVLESLHAAGTFSGGKTFFRTDASEV